MAEIGLRLEGGAKLRRQLKKAGIDMRDMKAAGLAAGSIALTEARNSSPRRTGKMASSLTIRGGARAVIISSRHPGAAVIHWGWGRRRIKSQPWVTKSAQRTEPTWTQAYIRHVNSIIDRIR